MAKGPIARSPQGNIYNRQSESPRRGYAPVGYRAEGGLYYGWIRGWDDIRFPFTPSVRGNIDKPDFDTTNIGLLFPNGNTAEIIYIICQFTHKRVPGINIKPHVHFRQNNATLPTFKIDYKWYENGDIIPANFTTISTGDGAGVVYPYTSGNLAQIILFPEIDGSGILGTSSFLEIKFYRDDTDLAGDVLTKEFDIHCLQDGQGSYYEYSR